MGGGGGSAERGREEDLDNEDHQPRWCTLTLAQLSLCDHVNCRMVAEEEKSDFEAEEEESDFEATMCYNFLILHQF